MIKDIDTLNRWFGALITSYIKNNVDMNLLDKKHQPHAFDLVDFLSLERPQQILYIHFNLAIMNLHSIKNTPSFQSYPLKFINLSPRSCGLNFKSIDSYKTVDNYSQLTHCKTTTWFSKHYICVTIFSVIFSRTESAMKLFVTKFTVCHQSIHQTLNLPY